MAPGAAVNECEPLVEARDPLVIGPTPPLVGGDRPSGSPIRPSRTLRGRRWTLSARHGPRFTRQRNRQRRRWMLSARHSLRSPCQRTRYDCRSTRRPSRNAPTRRHRELSRRRRALPRHQRKRAARTCHDPAGGPPAGGADPSAGAEISYQPVDSDPLQSGAFAGTRPSRPASPGPTRTRRSSCSINPGRAWNWWSSRGKAGTSGAVGDSGAQGRARGPVPGPHAGPGVVQPAAGSGALGHGGPVSVDARMALGADSGGVGRG